MRDIEKLLKFLVPGAPSCFLSGQNVPASEWRFAIFITLPRRQVKMFPHICSYECDFRTLETLYIIFFLNLRKSVSDVFVCHLLTDKMTIKSSVYFNLLL